MRAPPQTPPVVPILAAAARPATEADAALRALIQALARQAARDLYAKAGTERCDGPN